MKIPTKKIYLISRLFLRLSLGILSLYICIGLVQPAFAADSSTVTSPKKAWGMNEKPTFDVKYTGRGVMNSVFDWMTSPIREKRVVSAKLISKVSGDSKDLKEGQDFTVDLSSGGAKIELAAQLAMKPGLQTLVAVIASEGEEYNISQDFTWGVLAINANKSIYAPGEEAKLQFGVLDEQGKMVCNAKLELRIENGELGINETLSTENGRISVNKEVCSSHAFTLEPDYAAEYKTGGEGTYQLTLKSETQNGTYTIGDTLEVKKSVPFDVERVSTTRIYPMNKYPVAFNITANEDFKGQIVEEVPGNFEIEVKTPVDADALAGKQNSNVKTTAQNSKLITWDVDVKRGDKFTLEYAYDAPDISPEFYLLGPLQFKEDNKIIFQEARQWQIASDDTLTLRPSAAGTYQAWGTFGSPSSHWAGTSDQSDSTGVQSAAGDVASKETENLADTAQAGTINSVTAYTKSKAFGADTTAFSDGLEAGNFNLWTDGGTTTWSMGTSSTPGSPRAPHTGTYMAYASSTDDGALTSDNIDMTGATSFDVDFWYMEDDVDAADNFLLNQYDGSVYNNIADLQTATEDTWLHYTATVTDSQYFISNFRLQISCGSPDNGEACFADDVTITKHTGGNEQAKIIWKLGATEVQTTAQTISTSAFTDYSDARVTDPDGGAWSWTDVNNLEIGNIASTLGASDYIQTSEFWIVVDYTYTPPITVAGTSNIGVGTTVRVAVNTSLDSATAAVQGDTSWSINLSTAPSNNDIITVFATDGDGDIVFSSESTAITKYSSGSITGMVLDPNVLSIGDAGTRSVAVADLCNVSYNYDNGDNEEVMHTCSGTTLTVDGGGSYTEEEIDILSGDTLTVASETLTTYDLTITGNLTSTNSSTYNVAHNWLNNGAFTQSTSTVNMNGGVAQTISGSASTPAFNNLGIGNTSADVSATANFSVGGTLTISANATLAPSAAVVISGAGTLTGSGTAKVTRTSATASFGGQYTITNKTLTNLTVEYTGTGQVLTNLTYGHLKISSNAIATGTSDATVGGVFTVGASGVFTPSSGTMTFNDGSSIVNSGGTLTFITVVVAASATVSTSSSFSISTAGGGQLTVNSNGNFSPSGGTITIGTNITISNSGTLAFKNLTIAATPTVSTDFSVSGTLNVSGILAPTGGTITMKDGSQIVKSGTIQFRNLTIDDSATVTAQNSFSVSTGNFSVNSGATFVPDAAAVFGGTGTLTGNGTVQVTRTDATADFSTQYSITNKTLTNLTVAYVSDSAQTVSAVNYGNLLSSGSGARTLASEGTIGIGGTFTPGTNAYTITGSTVDYNRSGDQSVAQIQYNSLILSSSGTKNLGVGTTSVIGYLTLSGTAQTTTVANLSVGANLTVGNGTQLTLAGYTFSVAGQTSVTGTIAFSSATANKTFSQGVTLNSGAVWNETATTAIYFGSWLTNNATTFTASTGTHYFSGIGVWVNGSTTTSIANVSVSGTLTNGSTMTISTALDGAGSFTNGNTSTLNFGGSSIGVTTFNASTSGNTVNYNRSGDQTVRDPNGGTAHAYSNLTLSGTSAKTMTGVTAITGDLTISGTATMTSNAAFTLTGALNYSSTSGTTQLAASTAISIGKYNQTGAGGTFDDNGNTITVTGTGASTWTKSAGTFTSTGTVIFTGAAPQIGASNFGSFTVNVGVGNTAAITGAIDVNGDLTISTGIFSMNGANNINLAGNLTTNSDTSYSKGSGTFTFDGSGTKTINTNYYDIDLGVMVVDGSSGKTINNYYSGWTIYCDTLTIGSDDTFGVGGDMTVSVSGSGTPFVINTGGTFTMAALSYFDYTSSSATKVTAANYANLTLQPSSGNPIYTLGTDTGQSINISYYFYIRGVTVDWNTYDPSINIDYYFNGSIQLYSDVTWQKSDSASITFRGNGIISIADNTAAKQDFGNIVVGTGSSTTTLRLSSDIKATNLTVANGSTFNHNGEKSLTVYGNMTLAATSTYTKATGAAKLILEGDNGDETFEDLTSPQQDLGAVQIGLSPGTTNLSSDMTATSLTVNNGDTLNTKGYDLNIATFITVNGTLTCTQVTSGNGTNVNLGTTWTVGATATFTAEESETYPTIVTFDESSAGNLSPGGTDEAHDFYRIVFSKSSAAAITMQGAIDVEHDFTISNSNSTLDAAGYAIAVGGSWSNSGTFTHGNNTVTFDSADTGETIDSGGNTTGKKFYDVIFNNAGGGWTVQTSNVLIDNNLTFTSVSSWANTKTMSIRVGGTLTVAASQNIRMWNSSAITYSVSGTGSLYSMDHNSEDGVLYIWGDYHAATNDYWSYSTDFDNTGVSRRVSVKIDTSSSVTVDNGDTLAAIGNGQNYYTIVDRQGSSGGYGITVSSGGTINFNYTDFENLEGATGLYIQSTGVTSLDHCKFNNLVGTGGSSDAFITVDASVVTTKTMDYVQFDNSSGGAEYNINRTGTGAGNAWSFTNYTGLWAGASHEFENDANDRIQWTSTIDSGNSKETIEGSVNFEGSATFN